MCQIFRFVLFFRWWDRWLLHNHTSRFSHEFNNRCLRKFHTLHVVWVLTIIIVIKFRTCVPALVFWVLFSLIKTFSNSWVIQRYSYLIWGKWFKFSLKHYVLSEIENTDENIDFLLSNLYIPCRSVGGTCVFERCWCSRVLIFDGSSFGDSRWYSDIRGGIYE